MTPKWASKYPRVPKAERGIWVEKARPRAVCNLQPLYQPLYRARRNAETLEDWVKMNTKPESPVSADQKTCDDAAWRARIAQLSERIARIGRPKEAAQEPSGAAGDYAPAANAVSTAPVDQPVKAEVF